MPTEIDTKESKFPLNRVIAFAGPYIAIASGAVADWLIVHVHLLALFHTTKTQVAGAITQIAVFGLTSILVWLGQQKWLTGWQQWESKIAGDVFNGPDTAADPASMGEYDIEDFDPGDYEPAPDEPAPELPFDIEAEEPPPEPPPMPTQLSEPPSATLPPPPPPPRSTQRPRGKPNS